MCKSLFVKDMLHDYIVFMGVYTDAFRLCEGPCQQPVCRIVARLCRCDTMDDMVGRIVQPFPVIYLGVCWIGSRNEGHRRYDPFLAEISSDALVRFA